MVIRAQTTSSATLPMPPVDLAVALPSMCRACIGSGGTPGSGDGDLGHGSKTCPAVAVSRHPSLSSSKLSEPPLDPDVAALDPALERRERTTRAKARSRALANAAAAHIGGAEGAEGGDLVGRFAWVACRPELEAAAMASLMAEAMAGGAVPLVVALDNDPVQRDDYDDVARGGDGNDDDGQSLEQPSPPTNRLTSRDDAFDALLELMRPIRTFRGRTTDGPDLFGSSSTSSGAHSSAGGGAIVRCAVGVAGRMPPASVCVAHAARGVLRRIGIGIGNGDSDPATVRAADRRRERWRRTSIARVCDYASDGDAAMFEERFVALLQPLRVTMPAPTAKTWHYHIAAAQAFSSLRHRVCCLAKISAPSSAMQSLPADGTGSLAATANTGAGSLGSAPYVALYFDTRIDTALQTHVQLLVRLLGPGWVIHFIHGAENARIVRDVAARTLARSAAQFTSLEELLSAIGYHGADLGSFDPSPGAALARHMAASEKANAESGVPAANVAGGDAYNTIWKV